MTANAPARQNHSATVKLYSESIQDLLELLDQLELLDLLWILDLLAFKI